MRFLLLLSLFLGLQAAAQDTLYIDGVPCPPEGRPSLRMDPARRMQLLEKNRLKNRYRVPRTADIDFGITLDSLLGDGTPDQARFDESKAVVIEGYIIYVAKRGSAESCNCGTQKSAYTDRHIEIALDPGEKKGGRTVVIEITPRMRIKREWTQAWLESLAGKKVQVTGWLFYDREHERQACNINPLTCGKYAKSGTMRQTCWEIHPITDIDLLPTEIPVE